MSKQPHKLKVIWEDVQPPDASQRLAAAFEMLLAGKLAESASPKVGIDKDAASDNDQIAKPR